MKYYFWNCFKDGNGYKIKNIEDRMIADSKKDALNFIEKHLRGYFILSPSKYADKYETNIPNEVYKCFEKIERIL